MGLYFGVSIEVDRIIAPIKEGVPVLSHQKHTAPSHSGGVLIVLYSSVKKKLLIGIVKRLANCAKAAKHIFITPNMSTNSYLHSFTNSDLEHIVFAQAYWAFANGRELQLKGGRLVGHIVGHIGVLVHCRGVPRNFLKGCVSSFLHSIS